MLVYRLCSKEEIDRIFKEKDFTNVGTSGKEFIKEPGEDDLNTHFYESDKMYIHFFPKLVNLFYLYLEKGMYICYYDIPEEILNSYIGKGEYLDFFVHQAHIMVDEFAIESKRINFDYLKQVDLITKDIDIDDYFADESIDDFCKTIYEEGKISSLRL